MWKGIPLELEKYHNMSKIHTKKWYEGIIASCDVLIERYKKESWKGNCPLCYVTEDCEQCPWQVFDNTACRNFPSPIVNSEEDFSKAIERLEGWKKKAQKWLGKFKKENQMKTDGGWAVTDKDGIVYHEDNINRERQYMIYYTRKEARKNARYGDKVVKVEIKANPKAVIIRGD